MLNKQIQGLNSHLFTNQITGEWVTQNTKYSMLEDRIKLKTFINKIKYTHIIDNSLYKKDLQKELDKKLFIEIYDLNLYQVKLQRNYSHSLGYYLALIEQDINHSYLLKLDNNLQVLSIFFIQKFSDDCVLLTAKLNRLILFKRIYFLNNNVKVIKSIVKSNKKYISTTFSSQVRIS